VREEGKLTKRDFSSTGSMQKRLLKLKSLQCRGRKKKGGRKKERLGIFFMGMGGVGVFLSDKRRLSDGSVAAPKTAIIHPGNILHEMGRKELGA